MVSACLLDGEMGPGQLTAERIGSDDIRTLAGLVTVRIDDDLNAMYPDKTPSRVSITLADGRVLTRQVDAPKGDPRDPMESEDIAGKVRRFARAEDPERIETVIRMVMDLEEIEDITELAELL